MCVLFKQTQIDLRKGQKIQASAYSLSGQGPSLCLNNFSSVLTKAAQFTQSARPITSPFQKRVPFSRLAAAAEL